MFVYSPLDCRYSQCTEAQSIEFTDEEQNHYITSVEYGFFIA
jgi:hypothetical protein